MKILSYLLLGLVLISSSIHATLVEDILDQQISTIIEKGVQKNIIPLGAYYVDTVSHLEELNKNNKTEFRVTAIIKNLNNRTKVSFEGMFDEDLNSISYLYNYSFFNGAKSLSSKLGFYWLDYASSPNSTYCPQQDFSENSFQWKILPLMVSRVQEISLNNANTSNAFQDFMNYALIASQGNYPPPSDVWLAPELNYMSATFLNNYYVVDYVFVSFPIGYGSDYWTWMVRILYQPCSGQKAAINVALGSNMGDWRDDS